MPEKSHAKFASAFNFVKEMVEVWLLSKEWMQNLFEGTSCGPKYAKGTCMHQLQHNVGIVVTKSGIIFETSQELRMLSSVTSQLIVR